MFICKICDEEYDENMRYSRNSRYCKKCGEERTQYLSYRLDTLASLRSMPLEAGSLTPQNPLRPVMALFFCKFSIFPRPYCRIVL